MPAALGEMYASVDCSKGNSIVALSGGENKCSFHF